MVTTVVLVPEVAGVAADDAHTKELQQVVEARVVRQRAVPVVVLAVARSHLNHAQQGKRTPITYLLGIIREIFTAISDPIMPKSSFY